MQSPPSSTLQADKSGNELTLSLDENDSLRLKLTNTQEGIKAHLYSRFSENSRLVRHILPLLTIRSYEGDGPVQPTDADFTLPPSESGRYRLGLGRHSFAEFEMKGDTALAMPVPRRLSVFETRIIGRAPQHPPHVVPYSPQWPKDAQMPITDLHTHISAQVAGKDLIALGKEFNIHYPVEALDELGIDYPKENLSQIPRRIFYPLAHKRMTMGDTEDAIPLNALSPEALAKLENAFSFSPEKQSTYEWMEMCYYFREPFTKDKRLLPGILRKLAERYREQGIGYAELSSTSVFNPEWLRVLHEELPKIEEETGVQLRFLAGLPRNLEEQSLSAMIEQFKRIAKSPYVVGADVLGYETNKTSHLQQHLKELASWMEKEAPEMTLRIHAGENAKNPDNLKESLQLAMKYRIRMRVGHALHGIDKQTLELAAELGRQKRLILEFCPDSNLAGNNIDHASEIPAQQFIDNDVPSVLASDGSDLYRTDARQTALAGAFSGITAEGFARIRATEEIHIAEQQKIFARKMQALPADFLASLSAMPRISQSRLIHPAAKPSKALQALIASDKKPVLLMGAAGSSWDMVDTTNQMEVKLALKLLLEYLDPAKVYFITGRPKSRGVAIEMGKAVSEYNAAHAESGGKFEFVKMLAENQMNPLHREAGIEHIWEIDDPFISLSSAICRFIKKHDGIAYFIGGQTFTRNFILDAMESGIPSGLMAHVKGASAEKTLVYPDAALRRAVDIVTHAYDSAPELFLREPMKHRLEREYAALASRAD